jgi:acyl-CoA thioesterase FadM
MDGLRTTHQSQVTEDQIDHLGHMNVAFYALNAQAGTCALLTDLPAWDDRAAIVDDVYTRHHREQLLGTPLVVRSAVLAASPGGLRLHHELAADSGVLAATFVHGVVPLDESGDRATLPDDVVATLAREVVPMPHYAATRTLSLDHDPMDGAPSLATVVERGLQVRKERRITPAECDDAGRYRIEMAPMLTWGGEPVEGSPGPILEDVAGGVRMGWASMETRVRFGLMPRVGARIQSFGAGVAVHDKVTHRVHWTYDLDTEQLLTAFEAVSMAFDIVGRRPMSIPDLHRQRELDALQPDLAPGALT